jgi:hypothetical protein
MTRKAFGKINLIGIGLTLILLWMGAYSISDPDTWWHIKTGELILRTGSVPRTDPFSYVLAGREWITFEWLFQVLAYLAFAAGGAAGLSAMKILVLACAFLLFFRFAGGGFWAGLVLSLAAGAMRGYFLARPQVFDYLLMGLLLNLLDSGMERRRRWLWTCAAQVLWVNLHGGAALIGCAIVGLKALSSPRREAWDWAGLALACAGAMLLNPHSARIFTHTLATVNFPGKEQIAEWAPLRSVLGWEGLFLALGMLSAALSWRTERHLCLLSLFLGWMGYRQTRHMSLAILAIAPLLARTLARLRPVASGARSSIAAVLCMLAVSGGFVLYHSSYLTDTGAGLEELPDKAIEYLDANGVGGRMFHSYNAGGYLIWKAWPRRKVFVDGRNVEYGPRFITKAIHWYNPEIWRLLDSEWRFDYAFLTNSPVYRAGIFDESPEWALVFFDDAAMVYLRRTPANAPLIARDAYRLMKPNQLTFAYLGDYALDPRKAAEALSEIARSMRASERNVNAYQMRAFLLGELGRRAEAVADLKVAVGRFPLKPGPYLSLGWFYEKSGNADAAAETYARGIRVAKWTHDRLTLAYLSKNLGAIEERRGHFAEAERLYRPWRKWQAGRGKDRRP